MTQQQKKMIDRTCRWHETKVWATFPEGTIRLCLYNKNKQVFEFLTIRPNGESVGKEYHKMVADVTLIEVWKKLPKD
jgi:hypothetical protein